MRKSLQLFIGALAGILAGLLYFLTATFIFDNLLFFGFSLKGTAVLVFVFFCTVYCTIFLLTRKKLTPFAVSFPFAATAVSLAFLLYIISIRYYY